MDEKKLLTTLKKIGLQQIGQWDEVWIFPQRPFFFKARVSVTETPKFRLRTVSAGQHVRGGWQGHPLQQARQFDFAPDILS